MAPFGNINEASKLMYQLYVWTYVIYWYMFLIFMHKCLNLVLLTTLKCFNSLTVFFFYYYKIHFLFYFDLFFIILMHTN